MPGIALGAGDHSSVSVLRRLVTLLLSFLILGLTFLNRLR